MALTNKDCNLGKIDFEAVQNEVEEVTQSKKKRGAYCVYSPKERFNIAKYAVGKWIIKSCSSFQN